MDSKVSVIIPVYQSESYLDKCISSVLNQSYKAYEVILIDDGSTDRSGEICDRCASEHDNVKVYHEKNSGPAASRRKGVERASGEFIMFVDSDDWISPDMVSELLDKQKEYKADLVSSDYVEVKPDGDVIRTIPYEGSDIVCSDAKEAMHQLHGTRNMLSGPVAKLIRRDLFEGIDFCENVAIGEDYAMVLQLIEHSRMTLLIGKGYYFRCIRKSGISRSGYTDRHRQAFDHYRRWREYLLGRYPQLRDEIIGYHTEYELAVITAMCRSRNYDHKVINDLRDDLENNKKIIQRCSKTPLSMRMSARMIMISPRLFIFCFRILHVMTGR